MLRSRLAPFKVAHFRHFYAAQGVSLVGSWMQELAKSWIVIHLMGTSASIGGLLFAAAIPNMIFGSFGGVFADRYGARNTLLVTQIALSVLAFALGTLVSTGHIHYWHLVIFAVLEGSVLAFDMPAFNLVTPSIVPREVFQQALALNAVNFHLSRVLGPSIAGLVMAYGGEQSVFWINAASFMGVVFVIYSLPLKRKSLDETKTAKKDSGQMKEVLLYLRHHPLFFRIILQFLLLMALVFPLVFTTLRLYVQNRYQLTGKEFGLVFAAPGLGALVGSLSFLIMNPKNPLKILPYSVAGICVFLIAVAQAPTLQLTVVAMTIFSIMMFLTLSALLVTVQLRVEDRLRGRVSALIGMAFASVSPIMSVPIGFLSDIVGEKRLLWAMSILFGLFSALIAVYHRRKNAALGTGV